MAGIVSEVVPKPFFSVIIPTYNRAGQVIEAIKSVLSQTFQDFEIVIVDDGSTDNTRQKVMELSVPSIRYHYQENLGLPAAWNAGILLSRGQYLAFLDSDDTWLPGKLTLQRAALLAPSASPGVVTGYYFQPIRGERVVVIPAPRETNQDQIIQKNILHLGTTFACRRSVFDEVGLFDERLRRGQDADWLLRYRQLFTLDVVSKPAAVFNHHLSRNGGVLEESRLYFLGKNKVYIQAYGKWFYLRKKADIYRDLAYQFSREDNRQKALRYAVLALTTNPMRPLPGLFTVIFDSIFGTHIKKWVDLLKYGREVS